MNYSALGKRIREERRKLNLTQEQLAEDLNVSSTYIGLIERGQRGISLDTLVLLTNRLGITIDYLLQESVSVTGDGYEKQLVSLLSQASNSDKEFIINMIKLFLNRPVKES